MTDFTGLDANRAIAGFFGRNGGSLTEPVFNAFADALAQPNSFVLLVTGLEGLYLIRAGLEVEDLELLRDLAAFVSARNFSGYAASGRGDAIRAVAVRMLGGGAAEEEGDPEQADSFNPPPIRPIPLDLEA